MGRGPPSNAGEAEDDTELAHSAMSDSHARSAVNKGQRESNPSTPDGRPMCSSVGLASDAGLHLPHPFSAPALRCVVLAFSCTSTKLLRPTKRTVRRPQAHPSPPRPCPPAGESYRRDRRLSLHSSQSGSPTSGKKAGEGTGACCPVPSFHWDVSVGFDAESNPNSKAITG